jgi:hypothetical protein
MYLIYRFQILKQDACDNSTAILKKNMLNGRGHESLNKRLTTSVYIKAKGYREIWNDLKANKAYRVPAKCRDLLEMRTTFISLPKIDSLTWKTNGKDKGSTRAHESSKIPKPHAIEKSYSRKRTYM